MDRNKFAVIKYDHGEREGLSTARKLCLAVIGILAVGSMVVFPRLFLISLMVGLAAVMFAYPTKKLYVGPRYLICGETILYYANIQKVTLERDEGLLTLESSTGQELVLVRNGFHSGARKPDKIAAHKAARFEKVAMKIVDRVRRAAPDAQLRGIRDRDLRALGT